MDPALHELYRNGARDDEVAVVLRVAKGAAPPANVRIVSDFGDVKTARMLLGQTLEVWENVESLKAPSRVFSQPLEEELDDAEVTADAEDVQTSEGRSTGNAAMTERPVPEDGSGIVVGICDWGFDFTHANFRNADGSTRLLMLWDQRGGPHASSPAPFGYGRLHTREAINAALGTPDALATLGYRIGMNDAHGTHVADILAGNRREPGSQVGLASGADIIFVHLGNRPLEELANLGDSVDLLEGLDFCRKQARALGRQCVLHLSAGQTGGPKRGTTLLERAVDGMLSEPGIALVQSVGNYADSAMHTHARIGPNQRFDLDWVIPEGDRTPNELEVWYSGQDVFELTLRAPDGQEFRAPLGQHQPLGGGGRSWGNLYHRWQEPNCGLNHVDVFLYPAAPSGVWTLKLHGREVVDGRIQAWIERDARGRYQSRFPRELATSLYTTNTISNSYRAIAVGAHDARLAERPATRFSSRGPTADGRQKPELSAPGNRILAARSTPRDGWRGQSKLCVKSGTSMAAPWVSGTVALMMHAAGRPLSIHEIRRILIGTVDEPGGPKGRSSTRLGYGYLNIRAAVEAARALSQVAATATPPVLNVASERPAPARPLESATDDDVLLDPDDLGRARASWEAQRRNPELSAPPHHFHEDAEDFSDSRFDDEADEADEFMQEEAFHG
jgi:subtilisin family serine protease